MSKLYVYNLGYGLFPLDWEFCFLTVDEYKEKLKEKYYQNEEYNHHIAGDLSETFSLIDKTVAKAKKHFKKEFHGDENLRCLPMVFPIPKGDHTNGVAFCVILKRDEDGDTLVYSPIPLQYLNENI
ncbi:hypothetical protein [Flavobacterium johnsoniae]|uniref:Uncharacterized protein n=1 Tax=Flavobacterium johnsoniae (strain ATCC 17061 / DSM 2064 / JCM 8514 / BCRC 14874 / CCUG 350202 / NBRC 14942 / NCIMB 11054 / UW101) TaxID=376686 RepID=A5FAJ2_FLAJ1|nr:hypothetical protein [Flavobacterium johnsoniae]ABQ07771.1 hypothetical protein Fjoh_4772 [Flavobacterium johnsoniae UW101]OXG01854.1 hypothetical protein B0A63_04120 [Flavobacterium johnsoniae UW101]WQG80388.1 hypothetical protein SR927_20490 [Flavobacterium johnsoniae UW101]SHL02525.1 hypothetical protein SAMN05444146_2703 [Flavobacterium johnsoniae]